MRREANHRVAASSAPQRFANKGIATRHFDIDLDARKRIIKSHPINFRAVMKTWTAGLLLMLLLGHVQGAPQEMTFIAPANHTMPFASFDNGEISTGVVKDISEVLAQRMGYAARFRTVPGKRVGLALSQGEADGVCFVMPGWIDGEFNWTRPAIPGAVVVVANAKAPAIKSLDRLVKERIGTVLGYRYPGMEELFGRTLERDDAPSVHHSIAKLVAGRSRYAVIDQMTIAYYLKTNPTSPLRVEFTFRKYLASCAFARTSAVKFAEVERVLAGMAEDGTIDGILARYR